MQTYVPTERGSFAGNQLLFQIGNINKKNEDTVFLEKTFWSFKKLQKSSSTKFVRGKMKVLAGALVNAVIKLLKIVFREKSSFH